MIIHVTLLWGRVFSNLILTVLCIINIVIFFFLTFVLVDVKVVKIKNN